MDITHILNEIRELGQLDSKDLGGKFMKFAEEFGEFSAEAVKFKGDTHKPYDRDHLVEEAADALQVFFSILAFIESKTDITIEEVFETIPVKNKKWREKIPQYTKNDGSKS